MKYMSVILALCMIAGSQWACGSSTAHATDIAPTAAITIETDTNWTEKIVKTKDEWRGLLTSQQFEITRERGTERPFTSPLNKVHENGIFYCASCNNPLFHYDQKFDSGTGWPSFWAPYSSKSVSVSLDNSHGMVRDEVTCQRCDAHLGHVFDDGPKPTGQRYCMNGVALTFVDDKTAAKAISHPSKKSLDKYNTAVFASGCFWCVEAQFESIKGVKEAVSGYAGGTETDPTYEQVGSGSTGHAEAVLVYYDSTEVSYATLLKVYFAGQDPTQVNGQGPDRGRQYRSIIFYNDDAQKAIAAKAIDDLNKSGKLSKPVAAELVPRSKFWEAEGYHQNYVELNPEQPYVRGESIPRLRKMQSQLPELIKPGKSVVK